MWQKGHDHGNEGIDNGIGSVQCLAEHFNYTAI